MFGENIEDDDIPNVPNPKDAAETYLSQENSATMIENNDISKVTVTSAENDIITTWYDLYLYQ